MKLLGSRLGVGTAAALSALTLTAGLAGCGEKATTGGGSQETGGAGNGSSTPTPTATEPVITGKWTAKDPKDAFLEFTKPNAKHKGKVSGGDGCNGVQGDYTMKGTKVTIKRGLGTLKECTDVDDWLRKVQAVQIDGDTLTVFNEKDKKIGTLTRAE